LESRVEGERPPPCPGLPEISEEGGAALGEHADRVARVYIRIPSIGRDAESYGAKEGQWSDTAERDRYSMLLLLDRERPP
jgi:hypothetical protein